MIMNGHEMMGKEEYEKSTAKNYYKNKMVKKDSVVIKKQDSKS